MLTGDTCSFAPGTEEKILRLRTAENKFVLKAGIPNATKVLNGWNAGLRFIFCSVQSLYGFFPTAPGEKEQVSPYVHLKKHPRHGAEVHEPEKSLYKILCSYFSSLSR